jgi:hypothetical protein
MQDGPRFHWMGLPGFISFNFLFFEFWHGGMCFENIQVNSILNEPKNKKHEKDFYTLNFFNSWNGCFCS